MAWWWAIGERALRGSKLKTYRLKHFDPHTFQPVDAHTDVDVVFLDFVFDPQRHKGMLLVDVTEESLSQRLWIEITLGPKGWHIRPARGCEILPTVGLQRALDLTHQAALRSTAHNQKN